MKIRRKFICVICTCALLMATCGIVYAGVISNSHTYSNRMVMEYTLGEVRFLWDSAATAVTVTDYSAVCYTAVFGYKSSGTVVDSMSKRQAFYSEIVMEKNASYYRSFHSLLNGDMYPYGSSKELSTK